MLFSDPAPLATMFAKAQFGERALVATRRHLPHTQFIGSLKRCSAAPTDHGGTIPARQGIGYLYGAFWTVKRLRSFRSRFRHKNQNVARAIQEEADVGKKS